jgi:hypothetical protein
MFIILETFVGQGVGLKGLQLFGTYSHIKNVNTRLKDIIIMPFNDMHIMRFDAEAGPPTWLSRGRKRAAQTGQQSPPNRKKAYSEKWCPGC